MGGFSGWILLGLRDILKKMLDKFKDGKNLTGEKGRHRNSLISQIYKARTKNSDISIHDKSISQEEDNPYNIGDIS